MATPSPVATGGFVVSREHLARAARGQQRRAREHRRLARRRPSRKRQPTTRPSRDHEVGRAGERADVDAGRALRLLEQRAHHLPARGVAQRVQHAVARVGRLAREVEAARPRGRSARPRTPARGCAPAPPRPARARRPAQTMPAPASQRVLEVQVRVVVGAERHRHPALGVAGVALGRLVLRHHQHAAVARQADGRAQAGDAGAQHEEVGRDHGHRLIGACAKSPDSSRRAQSRRPIVDGAGSRAVLTSARPRRTALLAAPHLSGKTILDMFRLTAACRAGVVRPRCARRTTAKRAARAYTNDDLERVRAPARRRTGGRVDDGPRPARRDRGAPRARARPPPPGRPRAARRTGAARPSAPRTRVRRLREQARGPRGEGRPTCGASRACCPTATRASCAWRPGAWRWRSASARRSRASRSAPGGRARCPAGCADARAILAPSP